MQINSVGGAQDHASRQVAQRSHGTMPVHKEGMVSPAAADLSETAQKTVQESVKNTGFSLSALIKKALSGSRQLLANIWGESAESREDAGVLQSQDKTQTKTLISDSQVSDRQDGQNESAPGPECPISPNVQAAAASAVIQQKVDTAPYFAAVEDTGAKERTMWEKVKVKFQSVAGQLTRQFSGENTFQAKQEEHKEDLRRHSRYQGEDVQMECVLTDDSYLLDSYDKKGGYSRLTTKNR